MLAPRRSRVDCECSYSQRWGSSTATSGLGHSWTGGESRADTALSRLVEPGTGIDRRRRLDGEGDDVCTADDSQAQGSLLFRFDHLTGTACAGGGGFVLPAFDASEFFGIG